MEPNDKQLEPEFRLGECLIQPNRNRIVRPDGEARLEPRVMSVLLCLARHDGEVVSRDTLYEAVWPDTVVTDQAVTNCISELRHHLGDDRAHPRFIETVPKRGYRLICPMEPVTTAPSGQAGPRSDVYGPRSDKATHPGKGKSAARRRGLQNPLGTATAIGFIALTVFGAIYLWASQRHPASLPVQPLTTLVGTEWTGTWSPDGSQIAFLHTNNGSADISVKSVGAGKPRAVATGPHDELTPRWSPDGQKIAFLSDRGNGLELLWVPPTGGAERRIASTGIPFLEQWMGIYALGAMPWSPDGETLVFSRRQSLGEEALWRVDVDTGDKRQLTEPPKGHHDRDAAWSPDGRWIAFARYGPDRVGLWRIPASGGEAETVEVNEHSNRGPSWTPNGRNLVFFSDRSGSYDLWMTPAEGGIPRQMTAGPGPDYLPVVSSTGRVLFTRWGHQTDLYWMDTTRPGKAHERLTFNTRENYAPRVAPDGHRIAYHSDRSGNYEIWLLDRESGRDRKLTEDSAVDVMPDWSPSGERLVFLSNRDGPFQIYTVKADGSSLRKLSDHPVPLSGAYTEVVTFGGPRWSPDGEMIGFVADGESGSTLWLLDRETGNTRPSRVANVQRFDWYRDSRRVIYLKTGKDSGRAGLFAANLEDGEEVSLLAVPCAEIDVRPDGGAIAFVKAASHFGMNLYLLPLETDSTSRLPRAAGEPEALTEGQGIWHVHGGGWGPDGESLVYTRDLDHGDLYTIDAGLQ